MKSILIFKQGKFKLTTTQNLIPSDDDLLRTISRGMPGSAMPPWGHLPPSDSRALVAFFRTTHADAVRQEIEAGVMDGSFEEAEAFALLAKGYPDPPRSFVSGIFKAAWTDALPSLTQPERFPFVASSHS